jgi:hypothetical protein
MENKKEDLEMGLAEIAVVESKRLRIGTSLSVQ